MVCDYSTIGINGLNEAGLNPYSIGIWSATLKQYEELKKQGVLILILLEYGLRQTRAFSRWSFRRSVLILILLEYGLRP